MAASEDADPDPGYELVAEIVRQLAPDELPDLPDVWAVWVADRTGPERASGSDRILGSGLADTLVEWAPTVAAFVGSQIVAGAAVDTAKDRLRGGMGHAIRAVAARRRRRRSEPGVAAPPPYTPGQIDEIGCAAERTALTMGRSPEDAKAFGDCVVGALLRCPPGGP